MNRYNWIHDPIAETLQNNRWNTNGRYNGADSGPRRSAPAELPYLVQSGGKWRRGDIDVRHVKPKLFFVRPVDGKRPGAFGRFLDGITGEGPDVFVSKCGDKRTLMRDRPQRWQWSGWPLSLAQNDDLALYDKDVRARDLFGVKNLSWTQKARGHRSHYNFKTRKYESDERLQRRGPENVWIDARWRDGAKHKNRTPLSYRDGHRQWWTRVPTNAGNFAGGRPRNY